MTDGRTEAREEKLCTSLQERRRVEKGTEKERAAEKWKEKGRERKEQETDRDRETQSQRQRETEREAEIQKAVIGESCAHCCVFNCVWT